MIQVPQTEQVSVSTRGIRVNSVEFIAESAVERTLTFEPTPLVTEAEFCPCSAIEVISMKIAGFESGADLL